MPVPPSADEPSRAVALKAAFRDFITDPAIDIPDATNPLHGLLTEHFGADPLTLPTTGVHYRGVHRVGYQRAMDEFLASREHQVTGLCFPSGNWSSDLTLANILSPPTFAFVAPVLAPVDYEAFPSGYDEVLPCFGQALVLFDGETGPGVMWIYRDTLLGQTVCEVMTPTVEQGDAVLRELHEGSIRLNPYRGQLLELLNHAGASVAFGWGLADLGPILSFRERPRPMTRDEVILPEGLLDQIERHSIGMVQAHGVLRATGRHLKRGLLLHGRPGTGKTHTIKYLIGQMPDATVLWLSASRMYNLRHLRHMVDLIVPGVIVLDDVDLIAEDRSLGAHGPLFELLDVLDGIAEDQDILFLLTTNRPNEIEPAIAARPGRIDQAIEVPLPDSDCRRRLFDLYASKVAKDISDADLDAFIDRTDGVTASFIREVLRRATVAALEANGGAAPATISGSQVLHALDELLDPTNPLTPLLLGAVPKHALPVIPMKAEDAHVIHS